MFLLDLLAACSAEHSPIVTDGGFDRSDAAVDSGVVPPDASGPDSSTPDAAAPDAAPPGAVVRVHLRANADPVPHDPSTSGQTPRDWVSGVRSLHLLRSMDDVEPFLVFSHGDGFVEASYDDGADTVVGSIARRDLPRETFRVARVVHTHTQFTVDARLHAPGATLPGTFDNLVVLSDRTTLDGTAQSRGHYRYVFRAGGVSFPLEGEGLDLPDVSSGGFVVREEAGEAAYYFPASLSVDPDGVEDVDFVFEVFVHEGFRWIDEDEPGYLAGAFDVTPSSYEPIVQMGASSFRFFIE
jgi:hypothetical protein